MFLRIDHRKIHYKKVGTGPPLLMVHGWGGSIYSLHQLAQLTSKQYTVYLIDLPGFGKSDAPAPHWGTAGYAELVEKVIITLRIAPCHYFGHSFGGAIGIYLATHKKELLRTLILCNSSYKRTPKNSQLIRMFQSLPTGILSTLKPLCRRFYYRIFHRHSDITRYPQLENNLKQIFALDLTPYISTITTPTCIIWGERDSVTPVLWAYELNQAIAGSRIFVHPEGKHSLPLLHPHLVWQDIHSFLSS